MTMRNRFWLVLILLITQGISAKAQSRTDSIFILPDTAKAFTLENFYYLVTSNHPVALKTELLSEVARQEIRLACGNFDPKVEIQYLTKNFKNTEYYEIFDGSLKVPTRFPLDPKVGIERNEGAYLNPERYISDTYNFKQFYAGVGLPLGRGLITDERRTALKQADLFRDMTEAEQVRAINKLLLEAAKVYWNWYNAYYNFRLLNQGVQIASELFRRSKIQAEQGEAAPIDTVQAQITFQQRLIEQQEALLAFQNAGITLSTFLWDSLGNPLDLSSQFAPVLEPDLLVLSAQELQELISLARQNHPDLRKITLQLSQLDAERKLAAEFLKPRLDVSYAFLNQPVDPEWNTSFNFGSNYKFGVDFSFPVFLRKERAKLAQTKLKITSTQLERRLAEQQVINDISASYNTLINTASIISNQNNMVQNYERLLQSELLNFESGESDLFKINIQQEKLIQSRMKLLKLMTDYEKQKATLYWAAGVRGLGR